MKLYEKGFFKRNKKFFIIALMLFIVPAIISAIVSFSTIGDDYGLISQSINNLSKTNQTLYGADGLDAVSLFLQNIGSDLIVVVGGLLFSVISILVVMMGAIMVASPFGADLTFSLVSILPHGIIEYSASVIALVAAFNITKLEIEIIRNRSYKDVLLDNKIVLKDILILIIIMVLLLIVAAFIECNLTAALTLWYYGF